MVLHYQDATWHFTSPFFIAAFHYEHATCLCLVHSVYLHELDLFLPRFLAIVSGTFWQLKLHSAEDSAIFTHPESSPPVFFFTLVCNCIAFNVVHCNQSANKLR